MSQSNPTSVPSRVRRSQAERVALSDRRMTDAAVALVCERGVHETTLQAIGERAGYSRGLATHRFGSKAGLLAHVMKTASENWLGRLQEAVGDRVGAEALAAAVDALYRFIVERPADIRAMYLLWFQALDPGAPYRANMAHVHRAQRADVVRWVRQGQAAGSVDPAVDPQRCAEQFCATTAGIIYQWIVDPQVSLQAMCGQLKQDVRARLAVRTTSTDRGAHRARRGTALRKARTR